MVQRGKQFASNLKYKIHNCRYKQVDINKQDLLLFPIHDNGNHWTLLVRMQLYPYYMIDVVFTGMLQIIDIKAKTAEYFDSIQTDNPTYWQHIKYFISFCLMCCYYYCCHCRSYMSYKCNQLHVDDWKYLQRKVNNHYS